MKHIKNDRANQKLRLRAETLAHLRRIATQELRDVRGGVVAGEAGTESAWGACEPPHDGRVDEV